MAYNKTFLERMLPADGAEVIAVTRRHAGIRRNQLYVIVALCIGSVLTEAFGLAMFLPLMQFIEAGQDASVLAETSDTWATVLPILEDWGVEVSMLSLSFTILSLILLRQVVVFANLVYISTVKEGVVASMRASAFQGMTQCSGEHLQMSGSGIFVYMVHELAKPIGNLLDVLATLFVICLSFLVYGGGLFIFAPAATVISLLFAVFLSILVKRFRMRSRTVSVELVANLEALVQFLSESYQSWRLMKLSATEAVEVERLRQRAKKIGELNIDLQRLAGYINLVIVPLATLFALGGLYVSTEHLNLSLADITIFVLILLRLTPMVTKVIGTRQRIASILASISRFTEVTEEVSKNQEKDSGSFMLEGDVRSIRYNNVSFEYKTSKTTVLDTITLDIPINAMTAITGPSGAGKSTLADMLPRLIEPGSGEILINDRPITDFSLQSLRQHIAFVSQSPVLLADSIIANLRYGNEGVSDEALIDAARRAYADSFICSLPNGYDTVIGEAGSTLSGGQRQRIALARAFAKKAPILILDEPTSALDYESEQAVQKALSALREQGSVTVLIIAHRLSTIYAADQLLVMQSGKVVEQGTPNELKHSDSWYNKMLEIDDSGPAKPA